MSNCGSGGGKEPSGEEVLRLIRIRLATPSLEKIWPVGQDNSPRGQVADSSSRFQVFTRTPSHFPLKGISHDSAFVGFFPGKQPD
jgi:hypothetical protein